MTKQIKMMIRATVAGASETMSLNPTTNYGETAPKNAAAMMQRTWAEMGQRMQGAIGKVGREIGPER